MKMAATSLDLETKLAEERQKFFAESKFDPKNQKYGLFSYTGTLAISSRPYFSSSKPHRDTDGKVITGPRNFLTSPTKKGKSPAVYFSAPEYIGDPLPSFAQSKLLAISAKTLKKNSQDSSPPSWKPGGPRPEPFALFPHEASDNFRKVSKKGPDGKVVTEPRNFMTSPPKKGEAATTPGVLLGPSYPHMEDPYDRKRMIEKEERIKHLAKMQSTSFKSMDRGGRPFFDDRSTYGFENSLKSSRKLQKSPLGVKHDRPFYPVSSSRDGYFGEYPEHIPDTCISASKSPTTDKPSWKGTTSVRTIPTPSISGSITNLRTEFPALRRIR